MKPGPELVARSKTAMWEVSHGFLKVITEHQYVEQLDFDVRMVQRKAIRGEMIAWLCAFRAHSLVAHGNYCEWQRGAL
jgi:hypothetical protein